MNLISLNERRLQCITTIVGYEIKPLFEFIDGPVGCLLLLYVVIFLMVKK